MKEPPKQEGEAMPFNAAVATLMRLDAILKEITSLISKPGLPRSVQQHHKVRLVKAFYVQSSPLLKDYDKKDDIKKDVDKLKECWEKPFQDAHYTDPVYSDDMETKLDDALIKIQVALQEKGFFMPPRIDAGL